MMLEQMQMEIVRLKDEIVTLKADIKTITEYLTYNSDELHGKVLLELEARLAMKEKEMQLLQLNIKKQMLAIYGFVEKVIPYDKEQLLNVTKSQNAPFLVKIKFATSNT